MLSIFLNRNDSIAQLARFECLHELFEAQADLNPHNIAIACDDQTYTYQTLEDDANQLAHILKTQGLGKGNLVGILLERSYNEFMVLLAVLKVGASYLPLDPHYPSERLNYILSDAKADLIITQASLKHQNHNLSAASLIIEEQKNQISQQSKVRFCRSDTGVAGLDLCYVIYTSGSTGRPKGVQISHQAVCNYIRGASSVYGINSQDRVYHGFSLAFDAAVEEVWIAFFNGASLIVATAEEVRSGARLAEFLSEQEITIFSTVPTVLSMMDSEVKNIRVLISGGETLQQELYDRWAKPDRKIFNTYGPTETAIVATYEECTPHQPISIGLPLPNYEIYILNGQGRAVEAGVVGEIYIGGLGLAKGYLNQPELTAKKFIRNPFSEYSNASPYLYRTGDLAMMTAEGKIQFVGRSDNQVKLRGFRIDLSEIESFLLECHEIRHAVVSVRELGINVPALIAYIIPKDKNKFDADAILKNLQARLPAHMVPSHLEIIDKLPTLPNGKADRNRLPHPHLTVAHHSSKAYVPPRNKLEEQITHIWQQFFSVTPISINEDFFTDLGGHSLFAAKVVSALRKNTPLKEVSMLNLYQNSTIEKLSNWYTQKSLEPVAKAKISLEENQFQYTQSKFYYLLANMGQALACCFTYTLFSAQFLFLFLGFSYLITAVPLFSIKFLIYSLIILLSVHPLMFGVVILLKWLILGRAKPGNYRLWGLYYLRVWLVQRLQTLLPPLDMLAGTPLMNIFCRLMGAKIGKDCYIGTDKIELFDMLQVGSNTSIGAESQLLGYTVEQGWLKIGPIQIGEGCFIGTYTDFNIHTTVEDNVFLDDLSMLPIGMSLASGQYCGSPARPGIVKLPDIPSNQKQEANLSSWRRGLLHYFSLIFVLLIYSIAVTPGVMLISYIYRNHEWIYSFMAIPLAALFYVGLLCGMIVVCKHLILGKVKAGSYSVKNLYYVRKKFVACLMRLSLETLRSLYATLYVIPWLRFLGAKIGKRAEVSTVMHISPDLLTIEEESFVADSALIGAPRVHQGYACFAENVIGKRSFVGNGALLPNGTHLPDASLIGCLSIPPVDNQLMAPESSWFGSPGFFLPRREVFTGFAENETFKPTLSLYIKRLVIDFFRVITPPMFLFTAFALQFVTVEYLLEDQTSWFALLMVFTVISIAISIVATFGVVALKWLIMGRYYSAVKPFWSTFVYANEFVTGLYEAVAVPLLLNFILGTPFICWFLRLLGVKIGQRTYINTTNFTEFDLVEIGDDVALNKSAIIQTHLFEDRVMKMAPLKISSNCSVGSGSIVLFGTTMEHGSSLANLSLLMKGEVLPANTAWEGIPAQTTLNDPNFTYNLVLGYPRMVEGSDGS